MTGIYYAVVDGDPLTSGSRSRVYAYSDSCFIDDESGNQRRMAFIGDKAYCEKCDSTGIIIGGARVDNDQRMIDLEDGGRRQAVGGDYVLCKCPERPHVIARYGRNWIIEDGGEETRAPVAKAPSKILAYDQQFTLRDAKGSPLADTYYTVRLPSSELQHGVTDSPGRTERYETKGAQSIRIYLGHKQEA